MRTPDQIWEEIEEKETLIKTKESQIHNIERQIEDLKELRTKSQKKIDLENGIDIFIMSFTSSPIKWGLGGPIQDFTAITREGLKFHTMNRRPKIGKMRITVRQYDNMILNNKMNRFKCWECDNLSFMDCKEYGKISDLETCIKRKDK